MKHWPIVATVVALLAFSCGILKLHKEKDVSHSAESDALQARFVKWQGELRQVSDMETGWPSRGDCDGTLWAGLATAAGAGVRLDLAEYAPGVVHRRPFTPCYPDDTDGDGSSDSRSTVSRDMITGYLWGVWARGDLGAAQRLADYGESHQWIMGLPADANEVEMRFNLQGLLCRMVDKLSNGADFRSCAAKPAIYAFPGEADYERHIMVLGILLQGEVAGGGPSLIDIDGEMLDRIEEATASDPKDALFHAALGVYTGDYDRALELLNDDQYQCPSYVRGADAYCLVHKLFAASIVLKHHKG